MVRTIPASSLGSLCCVLAVCAFGCGSPPSRPPPDAGEDPGIVQDGGHPEADAGVAVGSIEVKPDPDLICLDGCLNIGAGETRQLVAVVKDPSGNVLTDVPLEWSSSDDAIASVDATGLVSAKRGGDVSIFAKAGGVVGEAAVHVKPARVARIEVSPSPITVDVGATVQLTATAFDDAGRQLDDVTFTWESSNPLAASVDETGKVTGLAGAWVVILASSDRGFDPGSGSVQVISAEPPPAGFGLQTISLGASHGCGLDPAGVAYCWGWNYFGQLGLDRLDPSTSNFPVPEAVHTTQRFDRLDVGSDHSCAITSAGAAWCWGLNDQGQLGTHEHLMEVGGVTVPYPVLGAHVWKSLSAGFVHTCGIDTDGVTWCWGMGNDGALGNGDTDSRPTPTLVEGSHSFQKVVAGMSSSCGLDTDGKAWCWGRNSMGVLGSAEPVSDQTVHTTPVEVFGGMTFSDVELAYSHVCALDSAGAAWCWGRNDSGQLGNGMKNDSPIPVQVATPERFTQLVTGAHHTCGLQQDGDVFCWGSNWSGQLGDGTHQDSTSPVKVVGGYAFARIQAGASVNCGETAAGEALCWGSAYFGESGGGTSGGFFPAPWPVAAPAGN